MQVNSIQSNTNNYSQQSFGAKMNPKVLKSHKHRLSYLIKNSKSPDEISELTNLAKRFEKYLKDINTEKNVATIDVKTFRECTLEYYYFSLEGLGYNQRLSEAIGDMPADIEALKSLMDNCPANQIKQTEREFLNKHMKCEKLKSEVLNSSFFSNKLRKFLQRLCGKDIT